MFKKRLLIRSQRAFRFLFVLVAFIIVGIFWASGARLPIVGGDSDNWGTILNEYLLAEHTENGSHGNVTAQSLNVTGDVFLPAISLGSCSGKLITGSDGNITCGTDESAGDLSNYSLRNESNTFGEMQNFSGAINIGNTGIASNGTIRWTGSDFQGFNGTEWVSLTTRAQGGIAPAFSVHRNGVDQSGVTTNRWVKVNFTTESFDTNGDYDTTNEWFKPSIPGKYLLTATVTFYGLEDYETDKIAIYKNGGNIAEWAYDSDIVQPAPMVLTVSKVVDADGVTDYFEIYVYHESGTDEFIDGGAHQTYFSGARIDGGNGLWTQNGSEISYNAGNVNIGNDVNLTGAAYVNNTEIIITANRLFKLSANTTELACNIADAGSIMFSDAKHYGCNGSDWNALY